MKVIVILFLFLSTISFAQNKDSAAVLRFAHSVVDTLASENFAGRGYIDSGVSKAARFMEEEFQKTGLKKIGDGYRQNFTMPINIIENATLKINGQNLQYGKDFLVQENSFSQNYHDKPLYYFQPELLAASLHSKDSAMAFYQQDMTEEKGKHVIFPPYHSDVDSVNDYYAQWETLYPHADNTDRAIFYFTNGTFMSTLYQSQDSIASFVVKDKYFSPNLRIDDYGIQSKFVPDYPVSNIIGKVDGKEKDSLIVITAHYDHLGKIGNAYFPGANDNASGSAFLLGLAKYFAKHKPHKTIVFIAFTGEEAGLVGSKYFADHPMIDLKKISLLLNFDMLGTGDDGIQVVNSTIYPKEFKMLCAINDQYHYVKQILPRRESCNSDHCPFYQKGVPSLFTYTLGGVRYYHDINDKSQTLPLTKFANIQNLFIRFISEL